MVTQGTQVSLKKHSNTYLNTELIIIIIIIIIINKKQSREF
jgi:hypothetical protein